ncbi:MAG: PKD domain-containing protein [bacterium]
MNTFHTPRILSSVFLAAFIAVLAFSVAPAKVHAISFGDVGNFFNPSGFGVPTIPNPIDIFVNIPMDPVVETKGVSDLGYNTAHIHGYVNPNGSPETWSFFEWGPTTGLGFVTGTLAIPVPSDTDFTLTNLAPSTTYYYRVVGKNSIFTERGPINSFTTLAAPVAPVVVPPIVVPPGTGVLVLGSCSSAPASPLTGNTVTWSMSAAPAGGTGTYTYAWTGTDGLTSTTATASKVYSTIGSKAASVTVTSGAQILTITCAATTVANNPSPIALSATIAPNPSATGVGGAISWTVTPAGGIGGYTYSWSGGDSLNGTTQTVSHTYYTPGTVTGTVIVTSGAQTVTVSATATVTSAPAPASGGGGGGGGANPPTVVLSDTRQVQASTLASAAFVYLNQVPYTGIEDYIASIIFLIGLLAVSFGGSWYFVFRKAA